MTKPIDDAYRSAEGHDDPLWPGVRRRLWKSLNTECKCHLCGKWSGFGLVSGKAPPYKYTCPECLP